MNSTIRDVARKAGVGVGTVSRVLNNDPAVSDRTRQLVLTTVKELEFSPDYRARALRSKKTGTIGVLVPFFTRHFLVEILRGIQKRISQTSYSLILFNVETADELDRHFRAHFLKGRVDGLLAISVSLSPEQVDLLLATDVPTVLIDAGHPSLTSVEVNHTEAAYAAVSHLIGLGHKRIAMIDRSEDPINQEIPTDRMRGYHRALGGRGELVSAYVKLDEYNQEAGRSAALSFLELPEPPTAIFAGSDLQACGALEAAKITGRRVPAEIAIVGYNDIELAEYVGLTTVRLPAQEMGETGVQVLLATMDGVLTEPTRVVMQTELVVRETCGAKL